MNKKLHPRSLLGTGKTTAVGLYGYTSTKHSTSWHKDAIKKENREAASGKIPCRPSALNNVLYKIINKWRAQKLNENAHPFDPQARDPWPLRCVRSVREREWRAPQLSVLEKWAERCSVFVRCSVIVNCSASETGRRRSVLLPLTPRCSRASQKLQLLSLLRVIAEHLRAVSNNCKRQKGPNLSYASTRP